MKTMRTSYGLALGIILAVEGVGDTGVASAQFMKTGATLREIAVGADGTAWGVQAGGSVWRWRSAEAWDSMPGTLAQISVGSAQHVWGVNKYGSVWRWTGSGWANIPGTLSQVSVASDGTVYGLQASGSVWRYTGSGWENVPGTLSSIAVAKKGDVWGLQASGSVWHGAGDGKWSAVNGEQIAQISAAADGTVYVLQSSGSVWKWNGSGGWTAVEGNLRRIAVGSSSSVWGTGADDAVYRSAAAAAEEARRNDEAALGPRPAASTPPPALPSSPTLDEIGLTVAKMQKDPAGTLLPYYMSRPEVRSRLDGALGKVNEARGKVLDAMAKLRALARDGAALGEWKTKDVCAPTEIRVKGSCKAYAQECEKLGLPQCRSECGKFIGPVCVQVKNVDCTSPCSKWKAVDPCLVWWPDTVTTEQKCTSVRYFDPSQGSVWTNARAAAEKLLDQAQAEWNKLRKKIEDEANGVLRQITRGIEGFLKNPPALGELLRTMPPFMMPILKTVFDVARKAMSALLQPILAKSTAALVGTSATLADGLQWLPRRRPAPQCNLTDDPVKQIRTSMVGSATLAILAATGKIKATWERFFWGPVEAKRFFKRTIPKMGKKVTAVSTRLAQFQMGIDPGPNVAPKAPFLRQGGRTNLSSMPPPSTTKWGFKTVLKKAAGPLLLAVQWSAVAAAGPYAHAQCASELEAKSKRQAMESYRACFRAQYIVWSRSTFFDGLVATATGILDLPITQLAILFTGGIAALVISAFPATAGWVVPTAAVIGIAMKIAILVSLTMAADRLIPWYLETHWPASGPGVSNVKKYFTERAEEASRLFPKQWYADKYYVNEAKNKDGPNKCSADVDCDRARWCSRGLCVDDPRAASVRGDDLGNKTVDVDQEMAADDR